MRCARPCTPIPPLHACSMLTRWTLCRRSLPGRILESNDISHTGAGSERRAYARCRDRARAREAVARGCGRSVSWRAQGASAALAPNVWLRLVLCRAHACPPPCGFRGALLQLDVRRSRCIREHMHVWCRCRAGLPVACESYAASAEHMCKCLLYVPVASRWGSSLVSQPNYMKERVERVVRPSQAQSV